MPCHYYVALPPARGIAPAAAFTLAASQLAHTARRSTGERAARAVQHRAGGPAGRARPAPIPRRSPDVSRQGVLKPKIECLATIFARSM